MLKDRISELETQVTEATERATKAEASLIGHRRMTELEKAGITVDGDSRESRMESLASMNEETWKIYLADVKTAKASSDEDDDSEDVESSKASLNFEDDNEGPLSSYRDRVRAFWG